MEGASSSSYSSTSTPPGSWTYHVFLSFRGEDTRKGFTDHLCASLERKGITTFRDDKDLERGHVISQRLLKAIEQSMFAIIILSPNYASSTWCLDELQKIVECKKNQDLQVLPVFYGVDPSNVRHQRESFEEAFKMHEEKFGQDSEKVTKWRHALRQVAGYSGWDSKDRHEAALVESIAQHIHKKLIPKLPSCTDNLVGIDSRVEEVNKLIGMGLNDVRFIGIWGMGGIGKTTISRAVYEAIQGNFEVSCFLENVREVSETNGLFHMQRQLLSRLNISSGDFYDLYDGKKIICNSLCKKKVLLVLDDVNEANQLENLAGKQDWFGPGSRVIITTRDMHLLMTHGVHKIYEVGRLFHNEALHLFCLKAFKQDQPEEGYLDLSKEVVEYTRGLPLAIEVLGSYLFGRNVDIWHSAVKKIRSVPHPKIQDKLKISYEGLDSMEKNIFLDIACFFKGMRLDKLINMLENCGYCPRIGIEILIERSLVTLDRLNNKLGMHDLLQEMGRNIVFQESPNDPGQRSRLWSQEDIDQVLTMNKGTEAINGILLKLKPYRARWSTEAFSKTTQLKFLSLCGMQLPLGLSCLPSSLKVLHWRGYPLKTLPLIHELNEIVDIILSHSEIEQLWQGILFMEKLKYLNLTFSKNLKRLPNFSGVPNLEKLVLKGCASLTEVHPSLVHHEKVVLINLEDCKSLKALPAKLDMSSLKELILSGCSEFKCLPDFGERMEHLSVLALEGTAIRKLPSSLGCLVGLEILNLKDCKSLLCLPDTIHGLNSLRILNISGCSKLCRMPEGLKEIKCLEELYASDTAIQELPSFILHLDGLKALSFARCKGPLSKSMNWFLPFNWMFGNQPTPTGFRLPPSASSLPSLKYINLSYCNLSEESIPRDFFHLSSLKSLDLTGNNFVSIPSSISKLSKLKFLTLNWCKKLQLLPELPSSIIQLDASNCDSLETSQFNPSKPCSLFASPIETGLPEEFRSFIEGRCLPTARFDMLIPGTEIPSWFVPQECVSWAKVQAPTNCLLDDWVGFALCFLIVSYSIPPELCNHEIECYLFGPKGKMLVSTRRLPPMDPCYPHLYILYLSIDQFRDKILEDDYWNEIEFALKCYCCDSLQKVRCGSRLVCKQDVEDWTNAISQINKS
ncbi:TMV resistance protein N-like [Abrus precatorius]|uniref:ADP-ribosyl cyclase/cyclic ADP-ribose hydrolase n=1 Tax=Abrus precatorius TaxID=3816 RepID=A0A8B8L771_ABRPR|nr:TMV resistance protein N-like [Abrus precatorius]